jgi:acetyl esterase/lipase
MLFLFLFWMCSGLIVKGQDALVLKNTSYTVEATFAKLKDKYKHVGITPVMSNPTGGFKAEYDLVYDSNNKRDLKANVFYPNQDALQSERPVVILIHGGGWRSGNKTLMTPMAEALALAGYFVMVPEYRLSLEEVYPAAILDIYAAVDWIGENGDKFQYNKEGVVVIGFSSGGQLAALVATTYHKSTFRNPYEHQPVINGIVDVDGILAFKHPDSKEGTVAAQWLGGTYEEVPENWEQASALTHVDASTPATLFIASSYPRFLAGRQEFIEVLGANQIYTQTKFLEESPHSFWLFYPWFEPTINSILTFLETINN